MHSRFLRILALTFSILGLTAISQAEGRRCSMATGTGDWAYTYNGVLIVGSTGIPVANVGRFTAKADGTFTGSQTRSLAGMVADETISGTFHVNADCTETFDAQVFQNGTLVRTATLSIVLDDNGQAARGIFSSLAQADGTPLPNVISVDARKVFRSGEK
jgi:hypothetical protein